MEERTQEPRFCLGLDGVVHVYRLLLGEHGLEVELIARLGDFEFTVDFHEKLGEFIERHSKTSIPSYILNGFEEE